MKSKNIKTHFDRNVFLTFLVLFILGIILFVFKMNSKVDCSDSDFEIIANSFTTEDLIEFNSLDGSGVEWEWSFGDETETKYQSNVVHQYKKPGTYKIKLKINGQCNITKEIAITKNKIIISPELIPNIIMPKNVRVGDEVEFSNTSKFAKSWQWSFGETLHIDGKDKKVKYVFKSPGEKTILLVVNEDNRHEAKQRITVLGKKERKKIKTRVTTDPIQQVLSGIRDTLDLSATEEDVPKVKMIEITSDKIKQMLVAYANLKLDDSALRNYFCYSSIPVFNKTGKRYTVNELFNEIRDKKIDIKTIKLTKNSKTRCIISITIDMKIKKGLFSKNF